MFVLQPNGPGGSGDSGGSGGSGSGSFIREQLRNFGTLGLYFGALHLAFLFMSSDSSSSSNSTPPVIKS